MSPLQSMLNQFNSTIAEHIDIATNLNKFRDIIISKANLLINRF